ncbi:MAG: undecaprenyldiphospho-muramoylpentapeptide beta-N-acetylglucosaminyltransferase [Lentimicrobium sp.]|jgi:UDP-N-acetylglucosamine--N-acetylmuramyl-(pentapeptide) pyrophosphoryl-undecaprenol N-acetylglucosamine transferase|nr:undecaprenyldiphospho-muramoylpentapeptide beta-N-acetylglucosaminyltransferase [Lentimicrobium sp.]
MSLPETRIIISGGGTGGHVFPAIAIADSLKKINPHTEILFVGALGRMEMEKVPAAGYDIEPLWISGLQRRLTWKNLSFPIKLIHSSVRARKIIRKFKPQAVVGVGGYASGPTVKAAASMGIPTIIQEQNSYPGITNKMLAKKAEKICVAYPGMEKFFPKKKLVETGNPVRASIINAAARKAEAIDFFNLQNNRIILLVVGGSLGARTINESIHSGLKRLADAGIQLIWQTGTTYAPLAEAAVRPFEQSGIRTFAFITHMDLAYAAADLVISRAGALAISELCATARPSILVPSPNVAEDHQTKNAMALVKVKAAHMVKDKEAGERLITEVLKLAPDAETRLELSENIGQMAHPDAAHHIARVVLDCIEHKKTSL